jgi:hypothetical protein|tara:strand:- start:3176 stop:3526 length:351 start_codon:yes stop_codon:yes gene_type:complete
MKRGNKKAKRYEKNTVVPVEYKPGVIDQNFMEAFLRESMHCGKCRQIFSLSSDELKVHCNICNDFFHCGIAGECIGDDCLIKGDDGESKHRARYCINCVSKVYKNDTCLCKSCGSK